MLKMSDDSQGSYRFLVAGRVQGVGFRQATRIQAEALGLRGWVRNRGDGRVEGVACGDREALQQFRDWLRDGGPKAAQVDALEWLATTLERHPGFVVLQ
jgi:acylphosphatase